MLDLFRRFFSSGDFMPHVYCYLNDPGLTWTHVISDLAIGLAYVAISTTLVLMVVRGRKLIPFHSMFLAFGLFIIACGATHFMEVVTVWNPTYWASAAVKVVTAVASVVTAVALPPLVPVALSMVEAAIVSEGRRAELEQANAELNSLNERLKEFDELKTRFFANVSHELRTPLGLILGPTETLLQSGDLTDRHRRDLQVILLNARTLLKHVNDLLDVARLDAGRMEVHRSEVDLAALVRLTAAHFELLAEEAGIRFTVSTPEAVPATVDQEKIERVLLNLLSNAFKFTPRGGAIRCTLETEAAAGGAIRLTVADSGPGVPPELREMIFERFRQVDDGSTRRHGGTGLGLSITQEFVHLHQGAIIVSQAAEGGASFEVTLPESARADRGFDDAVPTPNVDAERAAWENAVQQAIAELSTISGTPEVDPTPAAAPAADETLAPARVLVIEDNVEMQRFVRRVLESDYQVETAGNGADGLAAASRQPPDLIISDVMMPVMSGDELVRAARARTELDEVPILMLTAKADDDLRARLLNEGAQDYLMKPFSPEELRARTRNLVRTRRTRELLLREVEGHLKDLDALAAEVTRRKRELQMALGSMQAALEQAELASQVKSTFLRLVSHELRTPLTALQLQLQLLSRNREGNLSERQQEIIRKMGASANRLVDLIESLLEYARIESGRLALEVAPFDLAELAATAVEDLTPQAEAKSLNLRLEPPGELPPLRSDPRLVRLILSNLIGNAVKFTERGSVAVEVGFRDGIHRIAVRDTGPGVPLERQALIFEPFEQLENVSRKHTPGVGLGLALVKGMVEALGGEVAIESAPGEGSVFWVTLPEAIVRP